jgi:putative SOS response-associated peptidase YedK
MGGRRRVIGAEAFVYAFPVIDGIAWQPRYNIAPFRSVPVVYVDKEGRKAVLLRRGLIDLPAFA